MRKVFLGFPTSQGQLKIDTTGNSWREMRGNKKSIWWTCSVKLTMCHWDKLKTFSIHRLKDLWPLLLWIEGSFKSQHFHVFMLNVSLNIMGWDMLPFSVEVSVRSVVDLLPIISVWSKLPLPFPVQGRRTFWPAQTALTQTRIFPSKY